MEPGKIPSDFAVSADVPPRWNEKKMKWVPLLGSYLNIFSQMNGYTAPLEGVTDFIAADLESKTSQFVGKRVGYKVVAS